MKISNIRNFVIISHIDHGKSTLADRFLELTKTVPEGKLYSQYLDSMNLEKERGITIQLHPVRMEADILGSKYILNLVDTPGHIDFSYETSRALACVEGAILLVDAIKGIQAQTIFNLAEARKQGLKIIGAVNKIDLPNARVSQTKRELAEILNVGEDKIFSISAKTGANVQKLLEAVVERIPAPFSSRDDFSALTFDSKYDSFSGVVAYVRVFSGKIKKGDKIYLMAQKVKGEAREVGYFTPELKASESLSAGEIGYIKTGVKESAKVKVGDTIIKIDSTRAGIRISDDARALPGYKEPSPVLFLSVYPRDADNFLSLKNGLEKLKLNDPALEFQLESKIVLGRGFRCGFLGPLHAEIVTMRLKNEFGQDLILTSPQVIFEVLTKNSQKIFVSSPVLWPDPVNIQEVKEPWAELEIIVPNNYISQLLKILKDFQIQLNSTKFLSSEKSLLIASAPLREIISGAFYDRLKSSTKGYASFSFRQNGFRKANLVKLEILIAGKNQPHLSKIVPLKKSFTIAKRILVKLKEILPPQQFKAALQAVVSGKIIARETAKTRRKNVTAPLYGGDVTRKKKLLEIQKKGKAKLKEKGNLNIPSEVFLKLYKL